MQHICLAIVGPTASGKSKLAIEIAEKIQGEIICMDSTTIYKGFDIGSAKPSPDERTKITHHLVDELDPGEPFSAHHFIERAHRAIDEVLERKKTPMLVGGTYFYLKALQNGMHDIPPIPPELVEQIEDEYTVEEVLDTEAMHAKLSEYDPDSAKNIHPNDRYRLLRALSIVKFTGQKPSSLRPVPPPQGRQRYWIKYALLVPRERLNQNIVARTEKMLAAGLVRETENILKRCPDARGLQSIGYHEAVRFIKRELTEKQLRNEIIEKTRGLAKRQMTWLRSDPEMRFIDPTDLPRLVLEVENLQYLFAESA